MRATDHLKMIKEVVDRIHRENNISIDVAFVLDDALVRIYHREAEETLTYRLPDVSKNCLHNTALGKAFLSSLPEEQLAEKVARMVLAERTEKTIIDKDRLLKEIQVTRARQFSMCTEEYLPGLLAIGAPLYDPVSGKGVGAVSFDFSVLQQNASEIMAKYGGMITETAGTLSQLLPDEEDRR
jgi:DNA-binding IclR family transcriptional regulator